MKHWNTLNELETQVYRVREFKTLLDVTTRGIAETGSDIDEVTTVMYTLLGMIEDIDSKLYDQFQVLWDEVRTDSWSEIAEEDENDSQERWGRIVSDIEKMQQNEHVSEH
jgi:hypothetical protein